MVELLYRVSADTALWEGMVGIHMRLNREILFTKTLVDVCQTLVVLVTRNQEISLLKPRISSSIGLDDRVLEMKTLSSTHI